MTNSTTTLPAPRLQLRWAPAKPNKHKWNWACHYELVLPLREHDIRGEQGPSEDGTSRPNLTELVVPITSPTLR